MLKQHVQFPTPTNRIQSQGRHIRNHNLSQNISINMMPLQRLAQQRDNYMAEVKSGQLMHEASLGSNRYRDVPGNDYL